jgi:DNA repair exonuclease SbcCD ATPase subunit
LENLEAVEEQIRKYSKELGSKAKDVAKAEADRAKARAKAFEEGLEKLAAEAEQLGSEETLLRREMDTAKIELAHAKRVFTEFETGENPHRPRLAELRTASKKAIDAATALQEQREALEIQLERTRYWIKGFKDVRLHVLEEALSELEFATNSMLDAIGLVGWEVRYAVERETKSGTIARGLMTTVLSPQQSGDVKWKSYSGGEGQRLRIAGALALSEVLLARAGVSCNLEVLDEPSQHLSSEGVSDLCEFLASRARMLKKSIYLVDHMAIESTYFDNTVVVEKTAQGSQIT